MGRETKIQQVAILLEKTGQAHHQAFIETDGNDPDWPLWYANFSQEKLTTLLGADFSKRDLANIIIELDQQQRQEGSDVPWAEYYSQQLVDNYP